MRASFILFAFALGCGSERASDFNDTPARGGRGSASGGSGAGGAAGESGGVSGSTSSGGAGGASSGNGGVSSGGTSAAGGGGMAGDAGAAAGGSGTVETCPGTAPGCVIDWAGQLGTEATPPQDGVGQAAVFSSTDGVRAITGDGTYIYVAGNDCIRRVAIADATVETIAGQCGTPGYKNAKGADARFDFLDGIATDGTTLWVADDGNAVIRTIDLGTMDVATLTGQQNNPGYVDGSNSEARFEAMRGMTLLGSDLYLVEEGPNNAVRRIDSMTGDVDTVAGGNGAGNTNGGGDVAKFNRPRKLGSDGTDLFIGDTENHRLRKIVLGDSDSTSNDVTTFAGSSAGYTDATGTAAQFRRLRGVTFDGTDLIVADSDNCVIRKVTVAGGVVTTIAGVQPGGGCSNHKVDFALQAEFDKPMDIYFDPGSGDLFITEDTLLRRMYYQ